jgi:hypothetical protein
MLDSNRSTPLDGCVGDPDCVNSQSSSVTLPFLPIQVSVHRDLTSDMRATALADDIRRLVEVFMNDRASISKAASTDTPKTSEPDGETQIVIHLELAQGGKDQLIERIEGLVQTFFATEIQR